MLKTRKTQFYRVHVSESQPQVQFPPMSKISETNCFCPKQFFTKLEYRKHSPIRPEIQWSLNLFLAIDTDIRHSPNNLGTFGSCRFFRRSLYIFFLSIFRNCIFWACLKGSNSDVSQWRPVGVSNGHQMAYQLVVKHLGA